MGRAGADVKNKLGTYGVGEPALVGLRVTVPRRAETNAKVWRICDLTPPPAARRPALRRLADRFARLLRKARRVNR